jgi:hypothetical protein
MRACTCGACGQLVQNHQHEHAIEQQILSGKCLRNQHTHLGIPTVVKAFWDDFSAQAVVLRDLHHVYLVFKLSIGLWIFYRSYLDDLGLGWSKETYEVPVTDTSLNTAITFREAQQAKISKRLRKASSFIYHS